MKIHTGFEQGSLEWMQARAGIPTASEFDALITPKFKIKTGEGPKSYLAKKIAEAWQGGPLPTFNVVDMDQGHILEEEAIPWYELEFSEPIQRVAFITTDDGRVGCSPDGLIGDNCGIEIKCPQAHTHAGYLINGDVPEEYLPQIHGGMLITGRPMWRFISYRRHFPKLVLTVEHDDEKAEILQDALAQFRTAFDAAWAKLCEINGGPPVRRVIKPVSEPAPMSDDLIP